MRNYRHYGEAAEALKNMIADQIRNSCYFLPGEVATAAQIGVSRMTLRKALAQLESEGIIRRDRMRTEILTRRDPLAPCGKILFVAGAHHNVFILPAMERLWMKLGPEVLSNGGNLELFLVNHTTALPAWEEKISSADVIFLTSRGEDPGDPVNKMLDNISSEKVIFSLLETIPAENKIYMDNYSAGYMAGQTLINAGCRKIICISFDYKFFNNAIFEKRARGFSDALKEADLMRPDTIKLIKYPSCGRFHPEIGDLYNRAAREHLEEAYKNGCDGAFLISDEEIGSITMNLFRKNLIPSKLKLLTLNGVGDAIRNNPPISCISHATAGVVKASMEQLRLIAENKFSAPARIAVKPELYANQMLGQEIQLEKTL